MKKDTSNNPIAIGVLLAILAGALIMIFRTLSGDGGTAQNVPAPQAVTVVSASSAEAGSKLPLVESASRDPFFHASLRRLAAENGTGMPDANGLTATIDPELAKALTESKPGTAPLNGAIPASAMTGDPNTPLLPNLSLAPLPASAVKAAGNSGTLATKTGTGTATQKAGAKTQGTFGKASANPAASPSKAPTDPLAGLRLAAIIAGEVRQAVIFDGEKSPAPLKVGDSIRGLTVAAIGAREIVLADKHGLYTLPLNMETAPKAEAVSAAPKGSPASLSPVRPVAPTSDSKDAAASADLKKRLGAAATDIKKALEEPHEPRG